MSLDCSCSPLAQALRMQDGIQEVRTKLQRVMEATDAPVSEQKLLQQQLVGSTSDVVGLILSLVMYSPARFPQFPKLSMADGSLSEEQGPRDAIAILVKPQHHLPVLCHVMLPGSLHTTM